VVIASEAKQSLAARVGLIVGDCFGVLRTPRNDAAINRFPE
jgi:hypothetical protein